MIQIPKRQEKGSPIDGLNKTSFLCFGLGAILYAVSEAFWINFSAYFLINELAGLGNVVFLIAQIFEGIGILLAWLLISKLEIAFGKHMLIYIIGTILMIIFQPLVFLPGVNNFSLTLFAAIVFKLGSSMSIYSQFTLVSLVTNSRSRRKKLVSKITQFGLGGTFLMMLIMTCLSVYVSFMWKYFLAVCIYVGIGGISSMIFIWKIKQNQLAIYTQPQQPPLQETNWLKEVRFYVYGFLTICSSLYINIITAVYPYFVKTFNHITNFKYLTAVLILYLSAFLAAVLARKTFMFTGVRPLMIIGEICCLFSTLFYIFAFQDSHFGPLIYVGTSITGISKIIILNCTLNLINEMIGVKAKSRQLVYGVYMFIQKLSTGIVIYFLMKNAIQENTSILNFSWIYLPFILYTLAWLAILIERTFYGQKSYSLQEKKVTLKLETMKDMIVN